MKTMSKFISVMVVAILAASLTGCVTNSLTSGAYVRQEARVAQRVETGTVVSVRSVQIEPRIDSPTLAAGLGAGIGGLIGSKVGKGNGSIVSAIVGVALGGVVGQQVGKIVQTVAGVEITYSTNAGTFAVAQQDDGTRFLIGETIRVVSANGWNTVTRVAKL